MNIMEFDYFLLLRLLAAVVLGGVIGFERGGNHHEAGFRTHMILCLGAAMIMVLSECLVKQYGIESEIMRMGAQVISGVGFLGVGSIIVDGNRIRGITTAAGLWTTAGIGLAVGSANYIIACTATVLMLTINIGLKFITLKQKVKLYRINLRVPGRENLQKTIAPLTSYGITVESVKLKEDEHGEVTHALLRVKTPWLYNIDALLYESGIYEQVVEITAV